MSSTSRDDDKHEAAVDASPSNQAPVVKHKKLRRIRACDFCHRRSIRCKPSAQAINSCQNCIDFGLPCAYERPVKKRGVKVTSITGIQRDTPQQDQELYIGESLKDLTSKHSDTRSIVGAALDSMGVAHIAQNVVNYERVETDETVGFALSKAVREMVLKSRDKITSLVDVYFDIVYPIFPLFHKRTLLKKTARRQYLQDRALFSAIMAVCALASARARDGALSGRWDPKHFRTPAAEAFIEAAEEVMPHKLAASRGLNSMKAYALLALFGVQIGDTEMMHQHLGSYHSLVSMDGLHDEKNWPQDIGIVEVEERRRLFWSMYTLEVYCSIVWAGVIRCRESQFRVAYPNEIDDEFFSNKGFNPRRTGSTAISPNTHETTAIITDSTCWLHGWNFTTELYRVLEHAMDNFQRKRPISLSPLSPSDLFIRDAPSQSIILERVMSMYSALPAAFKDTRNMVNEMSEDIFGYQAANITATLQLVRMVLFTTQDATVSQKCAIANELLDGFSRIPIAFLRAISSPLLYQLAGIGSILGQVMIAEPLSESAYSQIRTALLNIADLLASLEDTISRNMGATARLRNLTAGIDSFMMSQRQGESYSTSHPPSVPNLYRFNNAPTQEPLQRTSRSVGSTMSRADLVNTPLATAHRNIGHQQSGPYATADPRNIGDIAYSDLGDGEGRLGYQIPPELLEDWPWPLDMSQDFPVFPAFFAPATGP